MAGVCVVMGLALTLVAAPRALTLQEALKLARERSPEVLTALTSSREERAARVGATPLFARNPWVEGGAGVIVDSNTPYPTRNNLFLGGEAWLLVNVPVELAMERQRRIKAADARIRVAGLEHEEAQRQAVLSTAEAFLLALHAQQSYDLATDGLQHSKDSLAVIQQGVASGNRTELEAQFAALAAGADEGRVASAEAARRQALHRLLTMLGMTEHDAASLQGALAPSSPLPSLKDARALVMQRPDIRVLEAQRMSALADANVAAAGKFPAPVIKAGYQYWKTEHAALTYLEMPLPVFNRGQGEEARARSRASGLSVELDARIATALAEVENAHALAGEMAEARELLEKRSLGPAHALLERLEADFAERRIDVQALLTGRRLVLEARREGVDAALREALARVQLDAALGLLR